MDKDNEWVGITTSKQKLENTYTGHHVFITSNHLDYGRH